MKNFEVFMKRMFGIFFVVLAMGCLTAFSAMAAPQVGPAGMAFYTPPAVLPTTPGDLIWYRTSTSTPPGGPSSYSWTIMYRSTDALGALNVVTGTVLVPKTSWRSRTPRPIVSYAVGTHGLAQSWAPSIQLENGTDYENSNIIAALKMGYAVLVTDNAGYTTGDTPTYMAGTSQGHAALDIVKAALQIPYVPLSANAKVGIWGYSQGGQTAAWAGQLQPTYAPGMNLVGVVAGGIPADFFRVADYIDGKNGSAFLLESIVGLATQYPLQIPFFALANADGLAAVQDAKGMGVFEALFKYMNKSLALYNILNAPASVLMGIEPVHSTIATQNLGGSPINVPVFLFHGTSDEFIELNQALDLKGKYCNQGMNVSYLAFPGEHIITQFQAAPYALSWLNDRFNGKAAVSSCTTSNPRPVTTANPVDGNLIISLKNWTLNGTMHLKTLNQDVTLPNTSKFTADTNMSANTIEGSTAVPEFTANINVILPLQVKMIIAPSEPMTGTASLDKDGILHVHGHMFVNLTIKAVGAFGINIPITLYTTKPIDFPINFDGPVASLGDGSLTFNGTTTFPALAGNLLPELFSALMSGPGQTFVFKVAPPLPTKW